jgi:hypothetical protein
MRKTEADPFSLMPAAVASTAAAVTAMITAAIYSSSQS